MDCCNILEWNRHNILNGIVTIFRMNPSMSIADIFLSKA